MTNKKSKIESLEPIFPEDTDLIIGKILEKYGLLKEEEESLEKFFEAGSDDEGKEIFENSPGFKIASLLRLCAEGKIPLANLPQELAEKLGISLKETKQMADDLEKTILKFIKWETVTEEEKSASKIITGAEAEGLKEELKNSLPKDSYKDIYREPIE